MSASAEDMKEGRLIELPYQPRLLQNELHANLQRFNVLVMHRRFGKTVFAINQLIKWVTECPHERPQGAYIAPLYKQAKRVAWEYLKEFTYPIPGMSYFEAELKAQFPTGASISLAGGDNPDSLRGIYLDGCILDEVAQMSPRLWPQIIRPALSDRKGKAIFIGTPFGMGNQFHKLYELAHDTDNWYRKLWTVEDTGIIDPDELEAARREMSEEEFEQEFMCSWSAAVKGAYFGKQMGVAENEGRIGEVPYDPSLPVITSFDLGAKDATVVWYWQKVGAWYHAIRCEAFSFTMIKDIVKQVNSHGYVFAGHIAPFDINVFEQGRGSRKRQYQALGINFKEAPKPRDISRQSGINKVRSMLPMMRFDRKNCADGIEALKMYRTKFDEMRQVFSNEPLHDWCSDFADSVRYFAIAHHKIDMYTEQDSIDYSEIDQGRY